MDRKTFMRELAFLLQDISSDERQEALAFYEDYFDEAGVENEARVISELGDPSRVAMIIKDGLKGRFDEHISAGNQGFSSDDYQQNYEVIDADKKRSQDYFKDQKTDHRRRWHEMDSRDKLILIALAIIAVVPLSFPVFGMFGGLFGLGFSFAAIFFCLFFGFWIITFILYTIAILFIVAGVLHLFTLTGAGLIYIGIGCLVMALGNIFGKIASWFFKVCIPGIVNGLSSIVEKIFHKGGTQS